MTDSDERRGRARRKMRQSQMKDVAEEDELGNGRGWEMSPMQMRNVKDENESGDDDDEESCDDDDKYVRNEDESYNGRRSEMCWTNIGDLVEENGFWKSFC